MTQIHTIDKEYQVDANAFIVSKTDLKGFITYCNKPFIKLSGYCENELIGKAHSIVRHPDMPKCVFKLLWDTISQKKEIFAYVKNRSKDGGFYWVFANVTASFDENSNIIAYYSVRRKPNPKAIQTIAPIYKKLLQTEQDFDMKKSTQELLDTLSSLGVSYDEFVNNLQRM